MTLPFAKEARRQFDPVVQQFGFVFVAATEQGLRYENDQVLLNINFDNGLSYELAVEIGRKGTAYPGPFFSLAEILRLRDIQDAEFVSSLMISDEARLPNMLARLVELTVRYASDFLMGNDSSFAQVEKLRSKESSDFELDSKLRHARSIVDVAWKEKDYGVIVKVQEPLESHLTPAEKKRLEYSRKQLLKALVSK